MPLKNSKLPQEIHFKNLDDLDVHITPGIFIIPNLIEACKTTLFVCAPGVDIGAFAPRIAQCIAAGDKLEPFGSCTANPAAIFYSADAFRARSLELLALSQSIDLEKRAQQQQNLKWYHPGEKNEPAHNLRSESANARMIKLIADAHFKAVVFDALDEHLDGTADALDAPKLGAVFSQINSAGSAVAAFLSATAFKRVKSELVPGSYSVVHIDEDIGAPLEMGGGFRITRKRTDINDMVPRKFRYFYTIVSGSFEEGFGLDEQTKESASKGRASARRAEVARMSMLGMSQKDIADVQDVNAATICRDLERWQAEQYALAAKTRSPQPFQGRAE